MCILTPYIPAPTGVRCQKDFCILLRGIMYTYSRPCIYSHPIYLRPQVQGVRKSSIFYACYRMYILPPYIPAPTGVGCQINFYILLRGMYILTPYTPAPTGVGIRKTSIFYCVVSYVNSHTLRTCAHRAPLPASPAEFTLARTTILARDAAASREVSDVDACGGGVDVESTVVGSTRLEDS